MKEDVQQKTVQQTIRLAIMQGRLDDARVIFEEQVLASGAPAGWKARVLAGLARAGVKNLEPYLDQLRESADGRRHVSLATLQVENATAAEALARLDDEAAQRVLSKQEQALRVQTMLRAGRFADALGGARRLIEQYPDRADFGALEVKALFGMRQFREGVIALRDGLNRWPTAGQFLLILLRLPLPTHVFVWLFGQIAQNRREHNFQPFAAYIYALLALRGGDLEDALAALAKAESIPHVAVLRRALLSRSARQWQEGSRLKEDPTKSVQTIQHPNARATLAFFSGVFSDFAQLPLGYLDALLSELPVNVIYVKDRRRHASIDGIPNFADSQERAAVKLREIADNTGQSVILTMGAALGGFTAIRYGALMGATAVLALGPVTKLGSNTEEDDDIGLPFVKWSLEGYSMRQRDVRPDLLDNPQMHLTQMIGAGDVANVSHGNRISDLPNVKTIFVSGVDEHLEERCARSPLTHHLIASGNLNDYMQKWVEEL